MVIVNDIKMADSIVSDEQWIDLELLSGYLENLGTDTLRQMMDLYVEQSKHYLNDISAALAEDDQSLWQEHCHKMKGAAASAGLVVVHALLVDIEKSTEPQAVKQNLLKQLQDDNIQSIAAFNGWLATV